MSASEQIPGWEQTTPPAEQEAPARFSRRPGNYGAAFYQFRAGPHEDDAHVTRSEYEDGINRILGALSDIYDQQRDNPRLMAAAVAAGQETALRRLLEDPEIAKKLMVNLRSAAAEEAIKATGRGLWSAVRGLFSKWLMIALVIFALAGVAGVQPAVKAARAIFGSSTQ